VPWETLAWARRVRTGSPGKKAVLMVLAEHADEANSCFPSQKLIADATEQSERTVRSQLADLEKGGFLRRERRDDAGGRKTDRYFLVVTPPANPAGDPTGNESDPTGNSEQAHRQTVAGTEELPEEHPENHQTPLPPDDVQTVFDTWVTATGRNPKVTKLTAERRKHITARLREYPLDDVLDAIRGLAASPFHMGQNDQRTAYNDVEHALRNGSKLERFRDQYRQGPTRGTGPRGTVTSPRVATSRVIDPKELFD
jgi:hypothetical protein